MSGPGHGGPGDGGSGPEPEASETSPNDAAPPSAALEAAESADSAPISQPAPGVSEVVTEPANEAPPAAPEPLAPPIPAPAVAQDASVAQVIPEPEAVAPTLPGSEPEPEPEPVPSGPEGAVLAPAAPEPVRPGSDPIPSATRDQQPTTAVSTEAEASESERVSPSQAASLVVETPPVQAEPAVVEAPTHTSQPAPAAKAPPTEPAPASEPKIGDTAPSPTAPAPPPVANPGDAPPRPVTETGRIVEGVVISVTSDSVELTLDDGRTAVIHRRNFGLKDEDPSTIVSVGDRAFGAELLREDPKSRVVLSRAWAMKRRAWEKVIEASEKNETVTGKVVSTSAKGLVVDVGVRGFVPSSHLELNPVKDASSYAGQSLELRILEVDPRKDKLVLSRRSLLLRAQRKETQQLIQSLKPGEVRNGTVASLTDYGAFVDLGGVSGLVHISELSWHRVGRPGDVVTVGEQVAVKILDVKPKKKRISLSLRQTSPDPLLTLEVGAVVRGVVTRLVDFGAFVAIGDAEGLVHLSELAEYRVISPEEVVAPGDDVGVKILSVDTRRRRIELSIRRAAEYGG